MFCGLFGLNLRVRSLKWERLNLFASLHRFASGSILWSQEGPIDIYKVQVAYDGLKWSRLQEVL